jgi:transposase-like protein
MKSAHCFFVSTISFLLPAWVIWAAHAQGMSGVRLIISDACMGLCESAAEFFPDAGWQRCIVHWYHNVFSHVPSTKVREIAAMLKAIHAGEDIVAPSDREAAHTAPDQSR